MGGEGSIQSMVESYKYNMNLLRKTSFSKKASFSERRKEYAKQYGDGKLEFKTNDPALLKKVRERVLFQRKIKTAFQAGIFIAISIVVFVWILMPFENKGRFSTSKSTSEQLSQSAFLEAYHKSILEGDILLAQNDWTGALFAYSLAEELNPGDEYAAQKMATAYMHRCVNEKVNCETALKRLNALLKLHPNNLELLEIRGAYYLFMDDFPAANKDLACADSLRQLTSLE